MYQIDHQSNTPKITKCVKPKLSSQISKCPNIWTSKNRVIVGFTLPHKYTLEDYNFGQRT